ncbi:hypothetical protein Agub_g5099, partial [Astrephomene gubernaculifera]
VQYHCTNADQLRSMAAGKIPDTVKAAIKWLSQVPHRLPTGATIGEVLSGEELSVLSKRLAEVNSCLEPSPTPPASTILRIPDIRLLLLKLTAEAVRLLPSTERRGGDVLAERAVMEGALLASNLLHFIGKAEAWEDPPHPGLADFARKLIKMQTVQACGRQLAAVASTLLEARAPDNAQQGIDTSLGQILLFSLGLLNGLVCTISHVTLWEIKSKVQPQYRDMLADALAGSRALEHGARALLLYLSSSALADHKTMQAAEQASYHLLAAIYFGCDCNLSPLDHYSQHAALALGVALLCAGDAGPTYGLPPDLLQRLAFLSEGSRSADPASPTTPAGGRMEQHIGPVVFNAMTAALHCRLGKPAHRKSSQALSLRLLRLMVRLGKLGGGAPVVEFAPKAAAAHPASTDEAAGTAVQPAPAAAHAATPTHILVVDQTHVAEVAVEALQLVRRTTFEEGQVQEGEGDVVAEWWRLAMEVAAHIVEHGDRSNRQDLARELREALKPPAGHGQEAVSWSPPAAPPPPLACAVAVGLLPWWERVLRRSKPDNPESNFLHSIFAYMDKDNDARLWLGLLLHSDPRQAAAWVVTIAKLLRGFEGKDTCASALAMHLIPFILNHMEEVASGPLAETLILEYGSAAADGQQRGGLQHLGRLMSFAVCQWLPAVVPLFQQVAMARMLGLLDKRGHAFYSAWDYYITPLSRWVSDLALLCNGRHSTSSSTIAKEAEGNEVRPASAACSSSRSGWGSFLLGEVAVVPLLGNLLHLSRDVAPSKGPELAELLDCCGVVASAFPQEVRAAVREASKATLAAPAYSWPPGLVRGMAQKLRESGREKAADDAVALAARLEAWGSSRSGVYLDFAWVPERLRLRASERGMSVPDVLDVMRRCLVPPAEACSLLRTCSNPRCANLAGASEVELPLQACGRCGGAWYCRRECQVAHWKAGHKEACVRR